MEPATSRVNAGLKRGIGWLQILTATAVGFVFLSADVSIGGDFTVDIHGDATYRDLLTFGFGADAIEPIYDPKFVTASEARLHPDELVLGLSVNGDSRAYPIWIMNLREIVNDNVGGVPVLVTW